jgi:outer membrane immunogenic protein
VDWLATFRPRAGLAIDNALLFVTGGLALADIEHRWARTAAFDPSQNISRSFSDNRWGWTVGAGVEWALSDRVTWKSEALYVSFADKTYSLVDGSLDTHRFTHNDELWVVRTGLNFKFGHDRHLDPVPLK